MGLFSSSRNWSPGEALAAGDKLYVPAGAAILYNETFGSADTRSSIGLTSGDASQPSRLVAWNAMLTNITLDNASEPAADFTLRHGVLVVAGTVTNDGGTTKAGRGNLLFPGNSFDIVLAPRSTLINTGTISATPGNTTDITGFQGSALKNAGKIVATGGAVTVSRDLTVYTLPDPTHGTAVALTVGPGFAPPSSATLLPHHKVAAAA